MAVYIILGVLIIKILYLVNLYNTIIKKRNETENAFGSIDTMLKMRYDLIPNLIETVKNYMLHEAAVFTEVTKLRSKLTDNLSSDDKLDLHNEISSKLSSIMFSIENYPDLKANANFLKLQASWKETEEQISASRRFFNAAVSEYNNSLQTFPSNIIASKFNFLPKKVFELDTTERVNISAKDKFNV